MRLILANVLLHFDLDLRNGSEDWLEQDTHVIWDKQPLIIKLTPVH
jgi:hypothetical protein